MKTLRALVCCVLLAGASQAPALGAESVGAAPKAARKAPEAAKPTEPPKIPGIEVARANGGFLGVQMVNGTFKISFFDAKKKPMAPDASRALLRWDPKYKVGKDQVVLNADADGLSLSSPRAIRPPYNFKLFITLIKEAKETPQMDEPAGETYTIDFRA